MKKKTRLCIFQKLIKIKETRLSIYMFYVYICIYTYIWLYKIFTPENAPKNLIYPWKLSLNESNCAVRT